MNTKWNDNYAEVFDAVKPLPVLPGINGLPTSMVAEYFEVDKRKIGIMYSNYKKMFVNEVKYVSHREIFEALEMNGAKLKTDGHFILAHWNGQTYKMPMCRQNLFSRKAILTFALILPNCEIANLLREYVATRKASDNEFFGLSKTNRLLHGDDTNVINDLSVIPHLELTSPNILDNYIGARRGSTQNIINQYRYELLDCGMKELTKTMLKEECDKSGVPYKYENYTLSIKMSDGRKYVFLPGVKVMSFLNKKAALRVIMLMDTDKAREIQQRLRKYEGNSDN